jgi:hypothetical protein
MSIHTHEQKGLAREPRADGHVPDHRSRLKAIRDGVVAVIGVVLGIAPHVLHHIGLLAGAALITGTSGNALFYAIGLVMSVPMLLRLYRRFRTPWAPAIAVAVFTGLFALSAFVIGPAISGTNDEPPPAPTRTDPTSGSSDPTPSPDHAEHHE